ncbi:MAG: hypothetical protein WAM09_11935, partial [Anaerolineales bacterium]
METFPSGYVLLCASFGCREPHQRQLDNRTLETNPHTLAGYTHGGRMDMYTLGKLALPVVVGIMGVAAVLT